MTNFISTGIISTYGNKMKKYSDYFNISLSHSFRVKKKKINKKWCGGVDYLIHRFL